MSPLPPFQETLVNLQCCFPQEKEMSKAVLQLFDLAAAVIH
jgi:hypothetical protein